MILRKRHPPEESVLLRVAVLSTILIAVAAVATQEEFAAQAGVAAVAICVGFWVSHVRRRASNWWLKLIISGFVLLVARDFFISLLSNPYDPRIPLARLFLWLQALHSFDLPARKDLKYSLASAVVLIAVASVYTRETSFGLLLVTFAYSGSVTLVAMRAAGHRAVGPKRILGAGGVLALAVLLAAGVLLAAVPRGQGLRVQWLPASPRFHVARRIYDRILNAAYPTVRDRLEREPPVFNPTGYIGFSSSVDLRLRGVLDHTVVMRVRATRPAFWRALAFDEYTGLGWRMRDREVEEYGSIDPRIVPRFGPDEPWPAGSESVVQTFYVEAEQPNVIFAAYRPFEVYFPAGSLGVDRYAGLRSPVPLERGLIYSVISRVPSPAPGVLRAASGALPDSIRARYLTLPPIPGRVSDLARRLTSGRTSTYEKALAVNRYLVATYQYDLQAPPLPSGADAVDHFLFVSGRGSCETFASAMSVLLRAAGVPARLVTGYTAGTYNVLTGYYEVRNSDAHAWVEVFLPRAGWIEFEATPGFDAPDIVAAHTSGQWLLGDAASWMVGRLTRMGMWSIVITRHVPPSALGIPAVAVLVTVLVLHRRRRWWVRRQHQGMEDVYFRMSNHLTRAGFARDAHVTPREYVASVPGHVQPLVASLTDLFEQGRYGGRGVAVDEEIHARHLLGDLARRLVGP